MNQLIDFIFDFETRSRIDLKKDGPIKYAIDPSTEATLLTWCFGRTGPIKVWRKGQPVPEALLNVARNPHLYRLVAQNVAFDYLIWSNVFSKLFQGFVRPELKNLEDLMALGCHFRVGASLESMAVLLRLPHTKDKEGRRLMLKQCKPNAKGEFIELTTEEWIIFERYGVMDTRLLRDIYYMLPPLPDSERWAWEWTMRRNLRGICIDVELVKELNSIVEESMPKLVAEFDHLVGYKFKMNSPVKCKEWFKQYYPWIENMGADTVRDMLASKETIPAAVRRALEIKDLAGSTSISKIKSALNLMSNGRIYNLLAFAYTQTKRWAGRGIQIHNFPRPDKKKADSIKFDMNIADLAGYVRSIRHDLKDPIGFVKNLLRRIWIPSEGKTLYCGDFSKVEPSVLFWLLGLGDIPPKWYEEMGAEIFNMELHDIGEDSFERQMGKGANLSCCYGTGWLGFKNATYKNTGILLEDEMAKKVVAAYRRKYPEVVKLWRDLEIGFRKAIYGETTRLCDGKVFIMPMKYPWKGVQIRLPSGNHLFYHNTREENENYEEEIVELKFGVEVKRKVIKSRKVMTYDSDAGQGIILRDSVYGGLLAENVVSSIAREISVPSMWRIENAGFDVLNQVHDEIWGEAEAGREEEFKALMCANPSWCDMTIKADLKCGVRYLK